MHTSSGGERPGRGENVTEKGGFLLQNREFVILGQKMANICYGLGDRSVCLVLKKVDSQKGVNYV